MKGIGYIRPTVVGCEPTTVRVGKYAAKARTGSSFTTIDGSDYQVVSHVEGAGVTRFKLAKNDGSVVTATQTEINRMIPLSPALAKFATLFRWAVSNSTDDIIKEAIRHAGLPVDEKMNWNSWFRHAYYSKMKADPSMVEEAVQQLLFKYLYENDMLRKNFDKSRLQPGEPLETAITKYLKYLFTNKYSEAQSYIEKQTGTERKQRNVKDEGGKRVQEKNPSNQLLFWTGVGRGRQKTVKNTGLPVYVKEKVEDAPHLESESREGEEGEYSLFDQMTSPSAAQAFDAVVKNDDLRKLRSSFFAYVKDELKQRDQTAASALLAFDLAVESEEGRPSDWVEEWTEGTGLSPSSQKVTLKKLGDWLLQFVKDYPEYESSHAFVKLIVDMVRKQEGATKGASVTEIPINKLMASLRLASTYEDGTNHPPMIEAGEPEAAPAAPAPAIYPSDADDAKAIKEIENEDEKKSSTPEFTGHYEAADEDKEECEGCGKRRVCNDGGKCHECASSKEGSMNKSADALTIPVKQQALLPDNAQWTNRFQVRSESGPSLYTIAQNKGGGWWGCSCPGWIRHKNCKHLRALGLPGNHQPAQAQLERAQSSPFPQRSSQEGGMKLDKNAKVNQKKADYTKFRAVVAARPQDVQASLEEFRDTFAMMASKTDAMLKNLGLKAAAEDAPLKEKIAAKRSFAAGLKKLADEAPGGFVEALGQMYQQLDDVADGIEGVAENLGIELPTVSPEPMDIADPTMVDPDMAPAGDMAPDGMTEGTQDAAQTLTPEAAPAAMPADPNAMPSSI